MHNKPEDVLERAADTLLLEADEALDATPTEAIQYSRASGFRLDELQIQNFGTYDGAPTIIRFGRGGAIFTGRNGVGKTTAIDAFRMLIAQDPNFNDATTPEAKRDRDIRTYYQGVVGKVRRDGQKEYRVLRAYEDRKFMAVLGIFTDAHGRAISAARLIQYDAQGRDSTQRYVIARDRLNLARDFPAFETARGIRASLADKRIRVYDTFIAYRAALSGLFGVEDSKQAWALFERAIGSKTVVDLTEFMRDLILPASALAETADQLVSSTIALDEAFQAVKLDELKIARLQRIIREIDELEGSFEKTQELQQLRAMRRHAAGAVLARAIQSDVVKRQESVASLTQEYDKAVQQREELGRRVSELEVQERVHGGEAIADWRRDIETRSGEIARITADLAKIAATLSALGAIDGASFGEARHTEAQWEQIKATLQKKSAAIPERTSEMEKTLSDFASKVANLTGEIAGKRTDLEAAKRARSNLPRPLIETRENLAAELGVTSEALPFFGELVRVSPHAVREGWEGALNRLLGSQARRLLIPNALYQDAAPLIDRRHLGLKLEYDRVDVAPWRKGEHGSDRAAGKLEVREDSQFAGYIQQTLDKRFDHACFPTANEDFRKASRALTRAGQSRDGNRHVKDDRRHIDDRSSFVLGWDTAERLAMLHSALEQLEATLKQESRSKDALTSERDQLVIQANQMKSLADALGDFDKVDIARIKREIAEREKWISDATANNPDYMALTAVLEKTRSALSDAKLFAEGIDRKLTIENHEMKSQRARLDKLNAERDGPLLPLSAWRGFRQVARTIDPRVAIFTASPELNNDRGDGIWEAIQTRIEDELSLESRRRESMINAVTRLAQDYLREFPPEASHLVTAGLTEEASTAAREEWRQRRLTIEGRELVRHRDRLQKEMTDAIDNGIVNIKTQLEKERQEIRDTIDGINETLKAVIYDPAHDSRIRFVPHDTASLRIATFNRDLKQVTDDWIGNKHVSIEDRYLTTKRFIDQVKDVPENKAWRQAVLDSRRWFTFIAQEHKLLSDGSEEILNDYDGASGASGGQKERLAMTVMAAGLAWRFGMVSATGAAKSFRVLMLDEAFKNSHDDTTRALLDLFKAFGFQMIFAVPSKNLAVVANHIERAFAVDTKNRRTILTVHVLKELVESNQRAAAASVLQAAKEAGVDLADLDLSEIDDSLAGLSLQSILDLAAQESDQEAVE